MDRNQKKNNYKTNIKAAGSISRQARTNKHCSWTNALIRAALEVIYTILVCDLPILWPIGMFFFFDPAKCSPQGTKISIILKLQATFTGVPSKDDEDDDNQDDKDDIDDEDDEDDDNDRVQPFG